MLHKGDVTQKQNQIRESRISLWWRQISREIHILYHNWFSSCSETKWEVQKAGINNLQHALGIPQVKWSQLSVTGNYGSKESLLIIMWSDLNIWIEKFSELICGDAPCTTWGINNNTIWFHSSFHLITCQINKKNRKDLRLDKQAARFLIPWRCCKWKMLNL